MENARPSQAESSAPNSADSRTASRLTQRQSRLLAALLSKDWILREEVDRISGASNGPQIISELRRKLTGDDGIDMRQIEATDRDGRPCRPGQYRLNEVGRARLQGLGFQAHG